MAVKASAKGGHANLLKRLHADNDEKVRNSDFAQFLANDHLHPKREVFWITSVKTGEVPNTKTGGMNPVFNVYVRMEKPTRSYKEDGRDPPAKHAIERGVITLSQNAYRDGFFADLATEMKWNLNPEIDLAEGEDEVGPCILTKKGKMYDIDFAETDEESILED